MTIIGLCAWCAEPITDQSPRLVLPDEGDDTYHLDCVVILIDWYVNRR